MPEIWENKIEQYFEVIEIIFRANNIVDEATKFRLLLATITKTNLFCPTLQTSYKPQIV